MLSLKMPREPGTRTRLNRMFVLEAAAAARITTEVNVRSSGPVSIVGITVAQRKWRFRQAPLRGGKVRKVEVTACEVLRSMPVDSQLWAAMTRSISSCILVMVLSTVGDSR